MISLIVATGENGEMGKDNSLPWSLPNDLKYFKEKTIGRVIIMGSKTFESLGSKGLPHRCNIVLTSNPDKYEYTDWCLFVNEFMLINYLNSIHEQSEVIIVGGSQIYQMFIDVADKIYLTFIHHTFEADTFFPSIGDDWKLVESQIGIQNEQNPYHYEFMVLERERGAS